MLKLFAVLILPALLALPLGALLGFSDEEIFLMFVALLALLFFGAAVLLQLLDFNTRRARRRFQFSDAARHRSSWIRRWRYPMLLLGTVVLLLSAYLRSALRADEGGATQTSIAVMTPPPSRSQPIKTVHRERVDPREGIEAAIGLWAKLWAARDTDRYLGLYSDSFRPVDGVPRQQWERTRRKRIGSAREIVIDITDLTIVQVSQTRAEATFLQHYMARGMSDRSRKHLTLEKVADQWKISAEQAMPIPDKAK